MATLLAEMMNDDKPANLDEGRVIELIHQHATKALRVEIVVGDEIVWDGKDKPVHKQFPMLVKALACGNVLLVGPAGSGKTAAGSMAAEALGRDFYATGAVGSEYKLTGFNDATGRYVRTAFRDAFEHGGVFLFDEIDASDPRAVLAFNAALANEWGDFPDGMIKKHPDFKVIAAANTYGTGATREYVGRNQLDAATIDRFITLAWDYDESLERQITGNDAWVSYVQCVRRAMAALSVRHVVSPRASMHGAKLLAQGVAREDVEDMVIWRGMDAGTKGKVRAGM